MDGGFAGEALYALTGYPTREWMRGTYTKDEVWKIVSEGDKRNYIMTTGVPKKAGWDSKGLPQGHAYSLLGAKEYNGEKLFQIRNPWGSELYNGNWSDKDTAKWTPEAKAALGHEIRDDGVFWVPLDDWMELFDKVTMNYYQDWKVQKKKVDFDRSKSEFALKFNNPKKQRAILGATGYHSRMFRDESCHPEERITDFQVQILD